MSYVKPETYTEELKAYLTYPPDIRIIPLLLDEKIKEKYTCTFPDKSEVISDKFSEELRKELTSVGVSIKKERTLKREGKNSVFGMPVQIRQIKKRNKDTNRYETESIRVRITGKNLEELHRNKDKLIAGLAAYKVTYTECIWISDIPEPTKKETKPKKTSPLVKKVQKMENTIADLKDEVEGIKKPAIQQRIKEERNVREGILK